MTPERFEQANKTLGPPPGMTDDECATIHVHADPRAVLSAWHPDATERARLAAGEPVFLWIYGGGGSMPPVRVTVGNPWEDAARQEGEG